MPNILRIANYNLLEYGMNHRRRRPGEPERLDRIAQVIGEVDADVWTIQELASEQALARLADATGLTCTVPRKAWDEPDDVACEPGNVGYGVGILWNTATMTPVPQTLRKTGSGSAFFHGLVRLVVDCGGVQIQVAATHLTPFGGPQIVTEANRVVSALTRPDDRPPGIVGCDSNGVTGDRVQREGGRWDWHAPDPYEKQAWYGDLIYQCCRRYDEQTGRRVHWADRAAGEALWSGGLHETGAILDVDVEQEPTVGYWPEGDPYGPRDIDHLRVTRELVSAVRKSWVHRTTLTDTSSDHRPKVAELDLDRIATDAIDRASLA
jgi:endonuclease/exonuclease/phosphatase family metal-dependent hydrolase